MSTPDITKGSEVYAQVCAACHQPTGQGLAGVFPPLDGSSWVTGPAGVPVAIILKGLQGPIEVNGVNYNSAMPAASYLTDEQIANVTSYIRQAWSNKAGLVDIATVEQVKGMIEQTNTPWTAEQLQALVAENSSKTSSSTAATTITPQIQHGSTASTLANTGDFDLAKLNKDTDNHWLSSGWVIGSLVFVVAIIAGLKKLTH